MINFEKQEKERYNKVQRKGIPGWSVNRTEKSVGSRNPNNQGGVKVDNAVRGRLEKTVDSGVYVYDHE